ncbi:MAG: radical SAM protein, partial [Candidatus Omnitrophica bacterium]|nr:radical SAM protein [Candidatus Omnitrophota bacterium]
MNILKKQSKNMKSLHKDITHKQPRTLKLKVGFVCNNKCIFCVNGRYEYFDSFASFSMIKETLEQYRDFYDRLILTGGEITIRDDFFEILKLSYNLGYKINLETNARKFSDRKFCEMIKYYDLNITTHIEHYKSRIHDLITRVPGSFNEAIKGIRNLRKHCKKITVKIMLNKINYKDLFYIVKFIVKLDIDNICFVFLAPYGYADLHFDMIVPYYSEIEQIMNNTLTWLNSNSKIGILIEGFPYCFVKSEFRDYIIDNTNEN